MVFSAGQVLTAAALNDVTLGNFSSYTPVMGNDGTATYTTRTGWYCKIGGSNIVFFNAYFALNAAGSGATDLTVTAPSNIDRTTRQLCSCTYVDGANNRVGYVEAFTSGSGAVFDKVRVTNAGTSGASTMSGAGLAAGSTLTVQGFYREQ
jgi:hypothetical protein